MPGGTLSKQTGEEFYLNLDNVLRPVSVCLKLSSKGNKYLRIGTLVGNAENPVENPIGEITDR
jgi:hypothetical protein